MSEEIQSLELWDDSTEVENLAEAPTVPTDSSVGEANDSTDVYTSTESQTDEETDTGVDEEVDKKDEEVNTAKPDKLIQTYFDLLVESNYLNLNEEDIKSFNGTEEDFVKKIEKSREKEKDAIVGEIFNALPPEGQEILNFMLNGGTDIEAYRAIASNDVTNFVLDTDDKKEMLLTNYYKAKNFSDEKIEKLVSRSRDLGELTEDSNEALGYFKEKQIADKQQLIEQVKIQKEEIIRREQAQLEELKTYLDNTVEDNKIPLKQNKDLIIKSLTQPIRLNDGTITTSFDYKLEKALQDKTKVAKLATLLENDFNLDFISTKEKTKQVKSLRDKLRDAGLSDNASKVKGGITGEGPEFNLAEAILGN